MAITPIILSLWSQNTIILNPTSHSNVTNESKYIFPHVTVHWPLENNTKISVLPFLYYNLPVPCDSYTEGNFCHYIMYYGMSTLFMVSCACVRKIEGFAKCKLGWKCLFS